MKNFKKFLLITLCYALILSTVTIPNIYEISPHEHHSNKIELT